MFVIFTPTATRGLSRWLMLTLEQFIIHKIQ